MTLANDKISTRRLSKDGSLHVTDEFYNTLISATGALLTFLGCFYLASQSYAFGKPWHFWSFIVYGFGVLAVFITSTLHHGIDSTEKVDSWLRALDYCAIPLKIAGTCTPFCLILLRTNFSFVILGLIWLVAIVVIGILIFFPLTPKWISTGFFLGLGWLGALIAFPVYEAIGWAGVSGLLYGGLFFTVGSLIYFFERPNPVKGRFGFHEIWHLFVFSGSAFHFYVMLHYLLPY